MFGEENTKKTTNFEEEDLLNKIKEIIPREFLFKSRLKHYIRRYREDKRPSFSFFEAFLRIMDFNKVRCC